MEITKEQILNAINKDENLLSSIQETDAFKTLFNNKVDVTYKEKIGEEVKKIHTLYDQQLEKAGFKPIVKEGGNKEKSYEMLDRFAEDYNNLKQKESSLNADTRISALTATIEQLKKDGGEGHYKGLYESAIEQAKTEKQTLEKELNSVRGESELFKKGIEISKAFSKLKINPDIPESVVKMTLSTIENTLQSQSEIREGNLSYIGEDGKVLMNSTTYKPKNTLDMLMSMDAIKDITITDSAPKGGGADTQINGAVETKSVEGKDTKRLNLDSTKFNSQSQFIEVTEKMMLDAGITVNDENWSLMKDKAFVEYNIKDLPITN